MMVAMCVLLRSRSTTITSVVKDHVIAKKTDDIMQVIDGQGGDRLLAEVHTYTEGDSQFIVQSGLRKVRDSLSFPT